MVDGPRLDAARLARVAVVVLLAIGVTACGQGGGTPRAHSASKAPADPPATAIRPVEPAPSTAQLERQVTSFWSRHPGAARFVVDEVQYDTSSLRRVLSACTHAAPGASPTVESQRVLACAPLVFFFYRYGRQASDAQATNLADKIFSYAAFATRDSAAGPQILAATLRGWGVPVAGAAAATPAPANSRAETALVLATENAIISAGTVRLLIDGYTDDGRDHIETISGEIGRSSAVESLSGAGGSATIRITSQAAFVSGNLAGLTHLLGMPSATAKRVGRRWVELRQGTAQYKDLATEETISALPASILPLGSVAVALKHELIGGKEGFLLSWRSAVQSNPGSTAAPELVESLAVSATAPHLPEIETTEVGSDRQVVSFFDWGAPFAVPPPAPSDVVAYDLVSRSR